VYFCPADKGNERLFSSQAAREVAWASDKGDPVNSPAGRLILSVGVNACNCACYTQVSNCTEFAHTSPSRGEATTKSALSEEHELTRIFRHRIRDRGGSRWQANAIENPVDSFGWMNGRNDSHPKAATITSENVRGNYAFQEFSPGIVAGPHARVEFWMAPILRLKRIDSLRRGQARAGISGPRRPATESPACSTSAASTRGRGSCTTTWRSMPAARAPCTARTAWMRSSAT
jgi:hypothetical protein